MTATLDGIIEGDETVTEIFNPTLASYRADPYPTYQRFRERQPVYRAPARHEGAPRLWYLFGYSEVAATLKDPRFGREIQQVVTPEALPLVPPSRRPFYDMASLWMLYRDPPHHTRLRSSVSKAFTARTVARLQPTIEGFADALLDKVAASGSMDLITDFAALLPVAGITHLLGLPSEDLTRFRQWSSDLAAAIDHSPLPEVYERASEATLALTRYLKEIIADRRRSPRDDFICGLLDAEGTGGKLSEAEIVATCILLLGAGQETTVDLIGNGLWALLRHPDQMNLLRCNPELAPGAIEELLRYDTPVQMTARIAFEDVLFGDQIIQQGDKVTLVLGAANRDPGVFSDPDRLDLTRRGEAHLSFGLGIHFCLGGPLARLTGQVAITTLLRRFPRLHLQHATPQWRPGPVFRGLESLPVSC